ncbi:MAG: S41 family peptidase [Muribaculaceae bacterium]|nr:S41 family peptidase [Muribaculaceae bacterium]
MRKIALSLIILLATAVLHVSAQHFTPVQKLQFAEKIIENFYVDSVKPDHIVEEAIVAMLKTLDPHSAYSNPEETRELNEPLQGNFSGIGIQFNMATDTVYVIQTIAGGPSERVGILAGDRIIAANDTVLAGRKMRNTEVMKHLRGPKGSKVKLSVMRKGVKEPIEFIVTRDDIPIYSVDASYMAAPGVGYIRISRFAESTPQEVAEAMAALRREGMTDLIIDLEDNGGGYMSAATDLAEMFLNKGDLLVYTKGLNNNPAYFRAEKNGAMGKGRVVVMVNQYSASASEILSGALQDHDRGIVVGRRTFGKGLVQRPFPMPDGSMIRLTVSRYYTPSGRCIQKSYGEGEEEYHKDILHRYENGELSSADSIHNDTRELFYTLRNHRPVYGGGGITPDLFVPVDTTGYSDYYRDLIAKGVVVKYVMKYIDDNRGRVLSKYPTTESFIKSYDITPDMVREVVTMAEADGVKPNEEQLRISMKPLTTAMKALIGRDLYDDGMYYRVYNEINPVYREALRVITNPAEYRTLLGEKK